MYNEFVPSFYWCSCHSCWSVTFLSARGSVLRSVVDFTILHSTPYLCYIDSCFIRFLYLFT